MRTWSASTSSATARSSPKASSSAAAGGIRIRSFASPRLWGEAGRLLVLVHIPEHRRRRAVDHAGERFAPCARRLELAERDVDHLIVGFLLHVEGDLLLLF